MGLLIQNNNVTLTDGSGNTRFTTARRMPHLISQHSGSFTVPDVRVAEDGYVGEVYGGGTQYVVTSRSSNDLREFVIAQDANIKEADAFVMPFFTVSSGTVATGSGAITGSGSAILRLLVRTDGLFAGAMVLSPAVVDGVLKVQVKTTMFMDGGFDITDYPYVLNAAGVYVLANTALTIGYRIYYGRFT